MKRERTVTTFLWSLSLLFGAAALFGFAMQFLDGPMAYGLAFGGVFAAGRLAEAVHPIFGDTA